MLCFVPAPISIWIFSFTFIVVQQNSKETPKKLLFIAHCGFTWQKISIKYNRVPLEWLIWWSTIWKIYNTKLIWLFGYYCCECMWGQKHTFHTYEINIRNQSWILHYWQIQDLNTIPHSGSNCFCQCVLTSSAGNVNVRRWVGS